MANWSNPLLTSTYTNFLTEVKDRDVDLALGLDPASFVSYPTNIPTNAIRWMSSNNRWEKYNGSTWGALSTAFSISLGTEGAPSLYFGTDTNTGLYSPGADQVAISTNGTGKLFVNPNGSIGIGTTTPLVHIKETAAATYAYFRLEGNGRGGVLEYYNGATQEAAIVANAGVISFQNTATSVERLRITATGDVNIKGAGNPLISTSQAVSFSGSAPVDSLVVTSAGLVGIGKASPGSALDIGGELRIYPSSGAGILRFGSGGAEKGKVSVDASSNYIVETAGSERMRLDASGNLGLGVTPNTWSTTAKAFQFGSYSTLYQNASGYPELAFNTYQNTSNIYIYRNTDVATRYSQTNGSHSWFTAPSGTAGDPITFTQAMTLDANGRLLVGATSSRAVVTGLSTNWNPRIQASTTSTNTGIPFAAYAWNTYNADLGAGNGNGADIVLARSNNNTEGTHGAVTDAMALGRINFNGSNGTAFQNGAQITAVVDGSTWGVDDCPTRLVFSITADGASSPTPRMIIKNGGSSAFYCDSTVDTIYSSSAAAAGTSRYLFIGTHSATAPLTGTNAILIMTNGNITNLNGSYGTISDAKLKENIVDSTSQWADLRAIKIRSWNFREDTGHETHKQIGPIAQELEQVCPGLVFEAPDRDAEGNDLGTTTKGVNQSVLYMKAVKALQEAMERIETLEAKVAALEAA